MLAAGEACRDRGREGGQEAGSSSGSSAEAEGSCHAAKNAVGCSGRLYILIRLRLLSCWLRP